jgi:hypothetical protein
MSINYFINGFTKQSFLGFQNEESRFHAGCRGFAAKKNN